MPSCRTNLLSVQSDLYNHGASRSIFSKLAAQCWYNYSYTLQALLLQLKTVTNDEGQAVGCSQSRSRAVLHQILLGLTPASFFMLWVLAQYRRSPQSSNKHSPMAKNVEKGRKGESIRAEMLFYNQKVSSDDPNNHRHLRWYSSSTQEKE